MAPPILSPSRAITTPGGRVQFSASGGSGTGYVYGFAAGGNRSGGSIDTVTGEYQAGARGPVDDLVTVTDDTPESSSVSQVSITSTLYRNYQSLTPAGRKGPLLKETERVYGGEKDIQFERARQAARSALLGLGPADALDYIGEERLMPRAVSESPPDDGLALDQTYLERQRTMWDSDEAAPAGGGHQVLLAELERAGFPMGLAGGAIVIQRTRLYVYRAAGVTTFADHAGLFDTYPAGGPGSWHHFLVLFPADFAPPVGSVFEDGDPSADLFNGLVRRWKPPKAHYVGALVVVSEFTWGWPIGVEWGDPGRTWGGSTRFVQP